MKPSWNYILTMRHDHGLPLKEVMELCPDLKALPRNHRGITS